MPGTTDRLSRNLLISKPTPSDLSSQTGGAASSLSGQLPLRKHRYSPFDRLGSKQFQPQKGQVSMSYV